MDPKRTCDRSTPVRGIVRAASVPQSGAAWSQVLHSAMRAGSTALSYSLKGTEEGKQAHFSLRTPSRTERDREEALCALCAVPAGEFWEWQGSCGGRAGRGRNSLLQEAAHRGCATSASGPEVLLSSLWGSCGPAGRRPLYRGFCWLKIQQLNPQHFSYLKRTSPSFPAFNCKKGGTH